MYGETANLRTDLGKILLILVFAGLFFVFASLKQSSLVFALAILFAIFFFLRDKLWFLLAVAAPALTAGEFLRLPFSNFINYDFSIAEALLLAASITFLLHKILDRKVDEIRFDKVAFFLAAYLGLAIVSYVEIMDLKYYLFGLKAVTFSLLSYFLAINLIDSARKLRVFIYGLLTTLLVLSLQMFYKFFTLGFSEKFFFERKLIILPLGPLATVAAIIALLLPLVLAFYFSEASLKSKAIILPVFGFGLFALFISLGKAAILASGAGLFYLFLKLKGKRWYFIGAFLAVAAIGAIFLAPLASGLLTRVKTTFIDANTQFRYLEYQTAWRLAADHPWFGVGTGQQLYYFKTLLNFDSSELVNNFFLQALLDYGLLGLFGVICVFVSVVNKTINLTRLAIGRQKILAFGFVAILMTALVSGLLEVTFFALPYAIVFWLTTGALMSIKFYDQ